MTREDIDKLNNISDKADRYKQELIDLRKKQVPPAKGWEPKEVFSVGAIVLTVIAIGAFSGGILVGAKK